MLDILLSTQFRKDLKLARKRGYDIGRLKEVVETLAKCGQLPERNKDHALTGDYAGFRECHIQPDWLLVYRIDNDVLELFLARTGTHSDIF